MASRDLGDAPLEGDANRPSAPRGPAPCSALALALIFLLASVYSAHSSRRLKGFTLLFFFFYLRSLRCVGPAGLPHRRPQANRIFYLLLLVGPAGLPPTAPSGSPYSIRGVLLFPQDQPWNRLPRTAPSLVPATAKLPCFRCSSACLKALSHSLSNSIF